MQTFSESTDRLKISVLEAFDREIIEKQLCYHTREHIKAVQRRARQIFEIVRPHLQPSDNNDRLALLLDFCAVAHDLVQLFKPLSDPHQTRQREPGVSEAATIERLFEFIRTFNKQISDPAAQLTAADLRIIHEAIMATVCAFDPAEQAIYQPALYCLERPISHVARILALADISSLAMDGIKAYNREGSLLVLEENPDVRLLLKTRQLAGLAATNPNLRENIRQRLLRRARFQISFAKSRLKRCPQELDGLPEGAVRQLNNDVFSHLTSKTVQELESTTPVDEEVSFETLVAFFDFNSIVHGEGQKQSHE